MQGQRILWAQLLTVFALALLTWLAIGYSLYWRFWWFDIPMHILGGVWAGFCAAWLLARRDEIFSLVLCIVFALAVGIGWEIFEYSEGIAMPQYLSYPLDTVKDIFMGLLGASLAFLIARRL
ncbi:hypothetical protein A2853_00550 [Candidatus Kaiserbacteria bacterium RIFCSPHIGHO2_01_FULL_55_17]|uniref:VanZ-like domain-containing protein n=1 Tax=Candidatus Kaiserbacteria bacterium RIFCSPHIGHO2_01_FULL_55_17 TaxID=1798484 RepID=A0A1F6D8Q1_9BACT|nr:MAG: hypothetical protein A2853_00550 [Candidatus Kaiserbacteria bacterium RIFCSPHIGHO2_01_FULL_55_17]